MEIDSYKETGFNLCTFTLYDLLWNSTVAWNKDPCTVFVLQPIKMSMRNTGTDTNQKKVPLLMVPTTGWNLHYFPLLQQFSCRAHQVNDSTYSLLHLQQLFELLSGFHSLIHMVCCCWHQVKSFYTDTDMTTANSLDTRYLVALQYKNTGNEEQSKTTTNNKMHCCINVNICFDFMFSHHQIALNTSSRFRAS